MGSSSFFNNPPVGDVIDEGGQGNSFFEGGPAYTQIDPVAIEHFKDEAAASAAASEASHQASQVSANASAASAAASHTSEVNAAASAAAALASKNSADTDAATATAQAGIATTQASIATTQTGTATTQAGIATTQAGNASTSASQALASKNAAATSETNAGTSATNAANSATAAATSASNAAAAVQAAAGVVTPVIDGIAAIGTSPKWAHEDHKHPADTVTADARVANAAGTVTPTVAGIAAVGTSAKWAHEDHVHPTDTSRAPLNNAGLTGTPTAPTPTAGDNSTKIATTAFVLANAPGGGVGPNVIINGDFRINQRVYVSGATLASGVYGHDRWKAGASAGTNYSFTQLKSSTQVTIAADKSIVQVIEDRNVVGGSYVLSWTGTAKARAGVNTATPSGTYATSPLLITGQTAGTVMSVEFSTPTGNIGTLGTVKLETGTAATAFVMTDFDLELEKCQRYYEKSYDYATAIGTVTGNGATWIFSSSTATQAGASFYFKRPKRIVPTVTFYSPNSGASTKAYDYQATVDVTANNNFTGEAAWSWYVNKTNLATNVGTQWTAEAEL